MRSDLHSGGTTDCALRVGGFRIGVSSWGGGGGGAAESAEEGARRAAQPSQGSQPGLVRWLAGVYSSRHTFGYLNI